MAVFYKKMKYLIILAFITLAIFLTSNVNAACKTIYGGGQVKCPTSNTSPASASLNHSVNNISMTTPQTKGGQPVYSTSGTKTTPPTGPELYPIIALILSGLIGLKIRSIPFKIS